MLVNFNGRCHVKPDKPFSQTAENDHCPKNVFLTCGDYPLRVCSIYTHHVRLDDNVWSLSLYLAPNDWLLAPVLLLFSLCFVDVHVYFQPCTTYNCCKSSRCIFTMLDTCSNICYEDTLAIVSLIAVLFTWLSPQTGIRLGCSNLADTTVASLSMRR